MKKDVKNIFSTDRDYKLIYFFTSQFVSDKERSKQEDALSKDVGIPVRIIDRTWIVEKVYANDHLNLAISTLGIEGAGSEDFRRPGPLDTARLAELEELDKQVADPSRYQHARFQLIEDCLRSAILARGLERPRNEVESRFAQADRLAKELDYRQQRMRIAYNRAWTAYWWYEDYPSFGRFYDEVEQCVEGSIEAADVERLLNLWQLLPPSVTTGRISAEDAKIKPRCERLTKMLQAIAGDPVRLNNALQARTGLALIKITQALLRGTAHQLDTIWPELSQIVDESATLGTYPVEQLSRLVHEMGNHFDGAAFDELYEKVVEPVRQRRSEGEAGVAYMERGAQKLQQGKPYDAIHWFGRAEELLVKEEYRAELVRALAGSSFAYERVGLLWAARNKMLVGVERSLRVFFEDGEMIPAALLTLQRLAWIELQLGRIPHVLSAMTLASFAASHLKLSEEGKAAYSEEVAMQDAVLGIHLLNIGFEELPAVSRLPDALERIGLTNARLALLFALGQQQAIYDEQYFSADESTQNIQEVFERWQDQPAAEDIPPRPLLANGPTSLLRSTILGSEIVLETPNNPTSFGVAESLLGALEAFLATSTEHNLFPHLERITITVVSSQRCAGVPEIHFSDSDSTCIELIHPAEMSFPQAVDTHRFIEWLRDSVIALLSRLFIVRDLEAWMEKVAGEERAFSRALMLGNALTLDRNVFGDEPKFLLNEWLKPEDKSYDRLRSEVWHSRQSATDQRESPRFGSGQPPADLFDGLPLKHTDRRVMSPIDSALWDRARWRGTLFVTLEGEPAPPLLGIGFENGDVGESIFQAWRERWGEEDVDEALRVAIVTGVSARNPFHYVVTIGPSLSALRSSGSKAIMTVSRINRMEPTSSVNLSRFLLAYRQFGGYLLVPAQIGSPLLIPPKLYLAKRHIREAWEIGENDPDAMGLQDDDDPIIPPTVADPPVKKALERVRAFRERPIPRPGPQ